MIGIGTSLLFDRRAGKGGSPIPPFNDAMVDAWFMSGLSNVDKPSSIRGVKGNEMQLKNFVFTSESGFGEGSYEGSLVFDGVDDYALWNSSPILEDYTVICKRKWFNTDLTSTKAIASKRKFGNKLGGAFMFERITATIGVRAYNYGVGTSIEMSQQDVAYQTASSYNGHYALERGTLTDTELLLLGSAGLGYEFAQCAIAYFALYSRTLTTQEIEKEKERLNEEWLKRKN